MVDGEWTFEGETYDKCILTLDSNVIKAEFFPQEKIAWGFHEGTSIYVNSNTNKIYIPEYCENGYGDELTVTVIDDESLLNYKGLLNPSDRVETDVSLINKIDIKSDGEYSIDVTNPDGITYDGKNNIRERFSPSYFCDGKSFNVANIDSSNLSTKFTDIGHSAMVDARGGVADIYKDETEIKLTSNGETEYDFDLVFNEGSYGFTPHCRFHLSGVTQNGVSVKQTDRGIIVSGEEGVTCKLSVFDVGFDDEKYVKEINTNEQNDALCIANNVLISFDDNGKIRYFIGDNYDQEVKNGDVNCDGAIDAVDASYVLSGYANASCSKPSYVGNILGDCNNDGVSDAVDASQILAYYAEQSVGAK